MDLMRKCLKFIMVFWGKGLSYFPRSWVRFPGLLLGFVLVNLFRFRKTLRESNLEIAFPEKSKAERALIGEKSIYKLCQNFFEFFSIPGMSAHWRKKHIVYEGLEHFQKAQSLNNGVFLLGMHMGNGDIVSNSIVADLGCSMHLISKVFKNKFLNDLWFSVRGYHGVQYIDAHGKQNAFEILKALKSKSNVVFVLDQHMGIPFGIPTVFFGKTAWTAYGLSLFYQKTKAPIVPVYSFESDDGKIHIVFLPMVDTSQIMTDDKEVNNQRLTQKFTEIIEDCVRSHPEEWMWIHRRWREVVV